MNLFRLIDVSSLCFSFTWFIKLLGELRYLNDILQYLQNILSFMIWPSSFFLKPPWSQASLDAFPPGGNNFTPSTPMQKLFGATFSFWLSWLALEPFSSVSLSISNASGLFRLHPFLSQVRWVTFNLQYYTLDYIKVTYWMGFIRQKLN